MKENDGICTAFICIGIAMYSSKEGVHKIAFKKQKAPHGGCQTQTATSSCDVFPLIQQTVHV